MDIEDPPPTKKCPWCPNPEGCTSCSISGSGSGNRRSYTLVPLTTVDRMIDKARQKAKQRWLLLVSVLTGALVAALIVIAALLLAA